MEGGEGGDRRPKEGVLSRRCVPLCPRRDSQLGDPGRQGEALGSHCWTKVVGNGAIQG